MVKYGKARSNEMIAENETVMVEKVDGMILWVVKSSIIEIIFVNPIIKWL